MSLMKRTPANIVREYGPFPGVDGVAWRHAMTASKSGSPRVTN